MATVKTAIKEKLIKGKDAKHFWCYIDMADEPLAERSPDPRYCKRAYNSLVDEIKLLAERSQPVNKKVWWWPKGYVSKKVAPPEPKNGVAGPSPNSAETQRLGVTKAGKNSDKGIITPDKVIEARVFAHPGGRPKKEIPESLIKKLARKGLGRRKIALILEKEHGITVSERTVGNIMAGQKALV